MFTNANTRANYETSVRTGTPFGQKVVYKLLALIDELRCDFNNWQLSHSRENDPS